MKFEDYSFFSTNFCGSDEEGIPIFRLDHKTKEFSFVDYYLACDGVEGRVLKGTFEVNDSQLTLTTIRNEVYEVQIAFEEKSKKD